MKAALAAVEADPASLGLILHGSRATGSERPDSDYDLIRIVTDAEHARREAGGMLHEKDGEADYFFSTLARLRWHAENRGWWTATYVTGQVVLDKTGEIEPLLRAIVAAANEAARAGVGDFYDGYLNSWVRSMKAWRRGDELGGVLHAGQSAVWLLQTLFGLERRWLPYLDALDPALPEVEWALGWDDGFLRAAVLRLCESGDPVFQQELEARIEALMASRGFPHGWGDDLEPLKALRFKA
jgi:hypothetical protein